jgi:hypothetical protein
MSDWLGTTFAQMRGTPPLTPFAAEDEVRERGEQRRRQHRVAVATAVLAAVLAVAAGIPFTLAVVRHEPVAPASQPPSVSVSPTLPGLYLVPSDLGPGSWHELTPERTYADLWYWANWSGTCAGYTSNRFPSLEHQTSFHAYGHTTGTGENVRTVVQYVEAYEPGWGVQNFADVRRLLELCVTVKPVPGTASVTGTIVAQGLAGDESLLIRQDDYPYPGSTVGADVQHRFVAVVRVGDQVSTLYTSFPDEGYVRALAQRAAEHLRSGG